MVVELGFIPNAMGENVRRVAKYIAANAAVFFTPFADDAAG